PTLLFWPSHSLLLHIYFFILISRPPRSTPLPYTTLFRSCAAHAQCAVGQSRLCAARRVRARHRREQRAGAGRGESHARRDRDQPDRKSTRLNSSHVKISYAVFCLKKKIK